MFTRKIQPAEVVQFTWDNVDELTALSGVECTRWDEGEDPRYRNDMKYVEIPAPTHHYACVYVGEWMVKENDVLMHYTDEEFKALFEEETHELS